VEDNQGVEEWFDEHDLLRDDNKIAREARHDRYRCRRDLIVVPQLVMLVEPFFHLPVILLQQVLRPGESSGLSFFPSI